MWKTNRTMIRTAARLPRAVLLGGAVLLAVGQPTPAAAQVGCGSQIGPDETVALEADLSCRGGGVTLTVVGPATLDLGGHRISCTNPNDGVTGISVLGERAEVRNGSVEDCFVGVLVSGAGNHVIENVVARDTCDSGFVVAGADGNRFSGNVARNAGRPEGCTREPAFGPDGFTINGSGNDLRENVSVVSVLDGFRVNGERNRLMRNVVSLPGRDGFALTGTARDNRLSDNQAAGDLDIAAGFPGGVVGFRGDGGGNRLQRNSATGFLHGFNVQGTANKLQLNTAIGNLLGYLIRGEQHQLTRNAAFGSLSEGYFIDGDRNQLTRNTAVGNISGFGILVSNAVDENEITRNTARGNSPHDLLDNNPNCGSSRWMRNTFQTSFAPPGGANPPCIQ